MDTLIFTNQSQLEALVYEAVQRAFTNQIAVKNTNDPNITFPEIMGLEQAAMFLGIAESTLYRYTSKRLIPYHKRHQKLYFKKADLQQWVEESKKNIVNNNNYKKNGKSYKIK